MTITKKYTSWKALSSYESQETELENNKCFIPKDSVALFESNSNPDTYIPTGLERFLLKKHHALQLGYDWMKNDN